MKNNAYLQSLTTNNTNLARNLNDFKMKTRALDTKVLSLTRKLQIEHEKNVKLRTELGETNAKFENARKLMVETLKTNTFNYRKLMEAFDVSTNKSQNPIQQNALDVERQASRRNTTDLNLGQPPLSMLLQPRKEFVPSISPLANTRRRQSQLFNVGTDSNQHNGPPIAYITPDQLNQSDELTVINEENGSGIVPFQKKDNSCLESPSTSTFLKSSSQNSDDVQRDVVTIPVIKSAPFPSLKVPPGNSSFTTIAPSTSSSQFVQDTLLDMPNLRIPERSSPSTKNTFAMAKQNMLDHQKSPVNSSKFKEQSDKIVQNEENRNTACSGQTRIENTKKAVKHNKLENTRAVLHNKENFENCNRPKRTRPNVSYKEPDLHSKMRRK